MSATDHDSAPPDSRQAASGSRSQSWSELAAGAGCAESLSAVAQVNPGALTGAELVDAIVASEKALSLLTARQMGLLTEFARPGRAGDVSELVAELMDKGGQGRGLDGEIDLDTVETLVQERAASLAAAEVAAALQISPITAGSRVRKAQDLCEGLPATAAALADGRIDRGRALLIAERTAPLTPSLREAVQDRVLPIAEDRSTGNLRGLLDRAVIAADPRAAENRERKAARDRELVLRSLPDGMASVRAHAPAAAALSIFTLADLLADRTGADDDRPVAARRVDAWHDIADQLLTHGYVDLTDLLDHAEPTAEPVAAQGMSNTDDRPAADRSGAPATPPTTSPVGNPEDCVVNEATEDTTGSTESISGQPGPRSATSTDAGAGQPSSAGQSGAVATYPSNQHVTPDAPALPTDGATPPAAAPRVPCATCGGHNQETVSTGTTGTTGNRDERRAARRAARQGRRPHLTVTLSASTLAGLDRLPGHLEGYGAITADTALMIARSAASITTVLLDPATGSITGTGARTYRPSQATRDITTTLATTCRFPSCRQPAWRCDLDHRDPFNHHDPNAGGATDPANLDPMCRPHHWLKHHTTWTSSRGPDHTQIWTSPTGHRYTDPPRTLTLPGELLAPAETPPTDPPDHDRSVAEVDDQGLRPGRPGRQVDDEGLRPDWRDAEFGGPFPDTLELKVLVTTVRNRIQRVRDIITAPRPTPTPDDTDTDDTDDHDTPSDSDTPNRDDTDPPTQGRRIDPDEPPF